jgi:hypothetical protein
MSSSAMRRAACRLVLGLCLAVPGVALVSGGAIAATIEPAGTSFTGTSTGPAVFTPNEGRGPAVTCKTATATGTTASPASNTVEITQSYSDCSMLNGLAPVRVETPGTWTLTVDDASADGYSGTVRINEAARMVVARGLCTITIAAGTTVRATGVNDGGSPPAGTTINPEPNAIPVPFSTEGTCLAVDRSKPALYTGPIHVPGIAVIP